MKPAAELKPSREYVQNLHDTLAALGRLTRPPAMAICKTIPSDEEWSLMPVDIRLAVWAQELELGAAVADVDNALFPVNLTEGSLAIDDPRRDEHSVDEWDHGMLSRLTLLSSVIRRILTGERRPTELHAEIDMVLGYLADVLRTGGQAEPKPDEAPTRTGTADFEVDEAEERIAGDVATTAESKATDHTGKPAKSPDVLDESDVESLKDQGCDTQAKLVAFMISRDSALFEDAVGAVYGESFRRLLDKPATRRQLRDRLRNLNTSINLYLGEKQSKLSFHLGRRHLSKSRAVE